MKNSKFSFKRAMALVICLCMVVSSLVFAPVVSAETEIANTNTQEYQYYDIDNTEFSEGSKYERASLKEDDGTGNYALKLKKDTNGPTAVYGQLDHALEAGKEYTVSFYVKGKSEFVVSFTDSPIYDQITKAQYIPDKSEKPYNNEEYTKVTLGPVTIPDDATYNTVRFLGYKVSEDSEYASAVCYIDNITIVENNNTPEVQNYDFDYVNFDRSKPQNECTIDAKDGDNTAIKLNVSTTKNKSSAFYGDLDFDLKQGKKYKVAFDLKGIGYFYVAFTNDYGWGTSRKFLPESKMRGYISPDGYTRYEVEMNDPTDTDNTYVSLLFLSYAVEDEKSDYYQAECYIDNISIIEECEVTLGAAENGTATLDKTSYYYGDTATLIATPDAGYVFAGWVDAEGNAVADTMKYTFEVAAPVTLTPVFEKAEANTAEYQKYDLDGVEFVKTAKEGKASVADDGTGNKAIRIEKHSGASHFYAQPEFAFKSGKRYIISMDVKGVNRFWFGLSSNCGYVAGMSTLGLPNKNEKTYTNDEYTTITFDTGVLTTDIYNSIYFCSFANADLSGSVGYIDNIVIEEYPNTQKKQGFDFDKFPLDNPKNEDGTVFSVVTEEDGNKALQVTTPAIKTKGYYMQLDFPVENNKKYKVAFDYKGEEGSFWVGLFDKKDYSTTQKKFPNGDHYFEAKEEYTHYELELDSDTDSKYICLAIMAQKLDSVEAGTVYYIDNIVLTEEVDVTVCTADNGTTSASADGKTIFYGDTVELTATGNPAYKFVKWVDENGEDVSYANPYVFEAEDGINLTPVFEAYEATEYERDFDNEEYNNMAPIVGNNNASVEYKYNDDIKKTVAKITLKKNDSKIAIPFVPKAGKDYRVKITYLYTKWFCTYYNGKVWGNEGPSGDAGKWLTEDWYYTQSGDDFFYLMTTNLATNAPAGEPCTIFIDSISFIESTKGDLNNDDAMDSLDITLLRKFLMGDNSNDIDLSAANVSQINDEDKIDVDVRDLVALKKKIVSNN